MNRFFVGDEKGKVPKPHARTNSFRVITLKRFNISSLVQREILYPSLLFIETRMLWKMTIRRMTSLLPLFTLTVFFKLIRSK